MTMHYIHWRIVGCAFVLLLAGELVVAATAAHAVSPAGVKTAARFSEAEISKLVEPIALYPDPLLQQILPAATFPDQIADAALLIRTRADAELIKEQPWDSSVKIIATYSGVLKMMYERLDWTTDLGNAFLDQHEIVLNQIQALRSKAKAQGNLKSNKQQKVTSTYVESGEQVIVIQPSDPQILYVPQQTTAVVYSEPVDSSANLLVPMATFGLGMALGAAMSDDHDNNYYYGGWGGPMWGGSSAANNWVDMRHSRNEDYHDEVMDRQDFRQDQRSDRQDFRQDWATDNPDKINSANVNKAKDSFQSNKAQRQQNSQGMEAQRQQKLNDARASMQSRDWGSSARSTASSASWSGVGGSSFASRASNRGSMSRSSSATRSSGGFQGGGGGFRGGRR